VLQRSSSWSSSFGGCSAVRDGGGDKACGLKINYSKKEESKTYLRLETRVRLKPYPRPRHSQARSPSLSFLFSILVMVVVVIIVVVVVRLLINVLCSITM